VLAMITWVGAPAAAPQLEGEDAAPGRLDPSFLPRAEVERLIDAYEGRIADHTDALDYRALGLLYLEDARQRSDLARYEAAGDMFRRASDLYPTDPDSRLGLARTAYGLHEFSAALAGAQLVADQLPGRTDAQLLVVDSLMALGRYEAAEPQLDQIASTLEIEPPSLLVRRSSLLRAHGENEAAVNLAIDAATATPDRPLARAAWFEAFAAQTALDLGEPAAAQEYAKAALEHDPSAPTSLITAARVEAALGDPTRAVELYRDATERRPDPTIYAELGELLTSLGDTDGAANAYAVVDTAQTLAAETGVYDRAIALSLADRHLDVEAAVAIARGDAARRQDVAAWDTLGWALYAAGDYESARDAADRALAYGSRDPRFLYHSGMIAVAQGDLERARSELSAALEINPRFQPVEGAVAEETLRRIS